MISRRVQEIAGSIVRRLAPPAGWDQEKDGGCLDLTVRVVRDENRNFLFQSAWEPTPEELKILNAGGSVIISVVGGQPPIWVFAENGLVE